jgi:hypothetical protein
MLTGIGGTLMFFGIAQFFVVIAMTARWSAGRLSAGHSVQRDADGTGGGRVGASARSGRPLGDRHGRALRHRLWSAPGDVSTGASRLAGLPTVLTHRCREMALLPLPERSGHGILSRLGRLIRRQA